MKRSDLNIITRSSAAGLAQHTVPANELASKVLRCAVGGARRAAVGGHGNEGPGNIESPCRRQRPHETCRSAGVGCLSVGSPTVARPRLLELAHRLWREQRVSSVQGGIAMSRKRVNAICRKFPGAEVSDPWGGGHDAWKVGGKMFACIGAVMPGVSVKTDSVETAQMLIDAGVGVKAPYFHRSWVNLPWGTAEDELRHRLAASYRMVRASLTKKAQAQLDPFE